MQKTHFHEGELMIQNKYNIHHDPRLAEMMLKDHISNRYVAFIEHQSTIIIATEDEDGNQWTSMLLAAPNFVKVKSSKQLNLNLDKLQTTTTDILFKNINPDSKIGILFIDTATRSRYRLNGRASILRNVIEITVTEAYPNCPKYIQQRIPHIINDNSGLGNEVVKGSSLTQEFLSLIKQADTFFMSSRNSDGDMDASHRGGDPGFIEILEDGILKIPDYSGNNLFNSLGNFMQIPKAGILFIDFDKGHSLQLTGATELLFDQNSDHDLYRTTNTGRYWLFKTKQWISTSFHNKIDWELVSFSPFNPTL